MNDQTDPHGTADTAISGIPSTEINTTTLKVKGISATTTPRAKEVTEYFHLRLQIEKAYELALPEFMIEIELEVHKQNHYLTLNKPL